MGTNQGWNHAGNIAAALAAMALVAGHGITSIFHAVGFSSVLATLAVFLIRECDLDERRATGLGNGDPAAQPALWRELLKNRTILLLFLSTFALPSGQRPDIAGGRAVRQEPAWFRQPDDRNGFDRSNRDGAGGVAHGPRMRCLGSQSDRGSLAPDAGWSRSGHLWRRSGGSGGGSYARQGPFQFADGIVRHGSRYRRVAGPLASGFLIQRVGFIQAFYAFAGLAAAGALVFTIFVPETPPAVAAAQQVDLTR
jgi:hypothetical protein